MRWVEHVVQMGEKRNTYLWEKQKKLEH
jgi:hypothetical protein